MRNVRPLSLAVVGFVLFTTQVVRAEIRTTVEAPGVQTSSAVNATQINFDTTNSGYKYTQNYSLLNGATVKYVGNQFVVNADQYGGANGSGQYLAIQTGNSVALTLSEPQAYFGMWLSAAEQTNMIDFFRGNTLVGAFSESNSIMSALPGAYLGNPNSAFLGADNTEPYAFINFYAEKESDKFDTIILKNVGGAAGFESDNHTFSGTIQPTAQSAVHSTAPVPEPSTLVSGMIALSMISGWGLIQSRKIMPNKQ